MNFWLHKLSSCEGALSISLSHLSNLLYFFFFFYILYFIFCILVLGTYRCWKSQIFSYQMAVVANFLKYYLCSLLLWSCSIYCWVLSVDSRRCTNITSNIRLCNYFDNTFQFHWFPFQILPSYLFPFYSKVLVRRGVCRNPGQNLAGRLLVRYLGRNPWEVHL